MVTLCFYPYSYFGVPYLYYPMYYWVRPVRLKDYYIPNFYVFRFCPEYYHYIPCVEAIAKLKAIESILAYVVFLVKISACLPVYIKIYFPFFTEPCPAYGVSPIVIHKPVFHASRHNSNYWMRCSEQ